VTPRVALRLLAPLAALALPILGTAAYADTLELHDGRVVEGVVEVLPEGYRVIGRLGESVVPKAEVKAHTAGATVDALVSKRLGALAADDAENRARLARWLVDLGRADDGRALAEQALAIDAENATAHAVLGHERHAGRWVTHDEAMRAKGLELHDGRWFTPEEWRNLAEAPRKAAEEADRKTAAQARTREVNQLVRQMAHHDLGVRERAKKRLEALSQETGNKDLLRLAEHVEAYVKAADEFARASADSAGATVLSELRISLSKLRRPIQVFETSLSSSVGNAPVRIQLPELEVINLRTMAGIPAVVGP
jgi:hypothetical protein